MSTQLIFYSEAKPISINAHRDLCVKVGNDYSFAKSASSVPLTAAEFPLAAAEYPIVFAGSEDQVVPVAVLGSRREQNLYLREDGSWNANYIPAFVRRYPFVFAQGKDSETLTLCIDEGFDGCNREGRGERLFDTEGARTTYLEQVLNFLRAYQVQDQRTRAFCKKLVELKLLQPVQAQLNPNSSERRVLSGVQIVDRAKLKSLDEQTLHQLQQSDELELIYLQLHSLPNLRVIGERMPVAADDTAPAVPDSEPESEPSDPTRH